MPIKFLKLNDTDGSLSANSKKVADSQVYKIFDEDVFLKKLVVSKTTLNPRKQTRGHSHPQEEVYIFPFDYDTGRVFMLVQDENKVLEEFSVSSGDVIMIGENTFHRVINDSDKQINFLCVFEKYDRK